MRKIYLILILISFVSLTFAQRNSYNTNAVLKADKSFLANDNKGVTDTLVPLGWNGATGLSIYRSANGGFVCGTNGYGDLQKAQAYLVDQGDGYKIFGAVVWFGAKDIVDTANSVSCHLYDLVAGAATGSTGPVEGPASTPLLTATVQTTAVDTGMSMTFTPFMFPSQLTVTSNYALSIDFTNTYPDTLGIVSTSDGSGMGLELAMEQWSDGSWYTLTGAGWGSSDIDMVIFPVVEMNTGVENNFVDGVKMSNYPNPATETTTINYEIQKSANVTIYITDMTGKTVLTSKEGYKQAGAYNTTFDVRDLSAGNYMYLVEAGNQRLAKILIVK